MLGSTRSGLLAYKMGLLQLWDEWGERHVCTVAQVTESATALIVTISVSRYSKVALNVLAVQIWLFTVPPLLYSVKKCLIHPI